MRSLLPLAVIACSAPAAKPPATTPTTAAAAPVPSDEPALIATGPADGIDVAQTSTADSDPTPLYVATCVTSLGGDRFGDGFELLVLARYASGRWERIADVAAPARQKQLLAQLAPTIKALEGVRWTMVASTISSSPNIQATLGKPVARVLENFAHETLVGISLGACNGEATTALWVTGDIKPVVGVSAAMQESARTELSRSTGGPHAHWWFTRATPPHPLLVGGNYSGMFPQHASVPEPDIQGDRIAYEGRWFALYDTKAHALVDWNLFLTSHY